MSERSWRHRALALGPVLLILPLIVGAAGRPQGTPETIGSRATGASVVRTITVPSMTKLSPIRLTLGSKLTISGERFGATRGRGYVKTGTKRCIVYLNWSATKIVCRVPTAAAIGKVAVRATTSQGTSSSKRFTATRGPAPKQIFDIYVDSVHGSDSGSGTKAAPYQTLATAMGATTANKKIGLKRGSVWREQLAIPANGMTVGAYGSGKTPRITGRSADLTSWSVYGGNVYQCSLSIPTPNIVVFGGVQGTKRTGIASCTAPRDWYLAANTLYCYATSNPATLYGTINAILLPDMPLVLIDNKNDVSISNLKLDWFDNHGVSIKGDSSRVRLTSIVADGVVTNDINVRGFSFASTASMPALEAHNCGAYRCSDGFFSSTPGTWLYNCRAFANRHAGLIDNGNANNLHYTGCHSYGNQLSSGFVDGSGDIAGCTDEGKNIGHFTPPTGISFNKYPVKVAVCVDDIGGYPGADTFLNSIQTIADRYGAKTTGAVMTDYASGLVSELNSWYAAGRGVSSHNAANFQIGRLDQAAIRYTGSGSACAMTVSSHTLTTSCTRDADSNLSIDLTNSSCLTMSQLVAYINGHAGYTCAAVANRDGMVRSADLADVSSQDIKMAGYTLLCDELRAFTDEATRSRNWLAANVRGWTPKALVYPGTSVDAETESIAASVGYTGGRGGEPNINSAANYMTGADVQNIMSKSISGLSSLTKVQIINRAKAMVFKLAVLGAPVGFYVHTGELTAAQVGYFIKSLTQAGAKIITMDALVDYVRTLKPNTGTSTYVSAGAEARISW